ncbi:MAG: type II secretion system protein GspG, partial [Thermoguttaceae bacterium]|nr:type II secretion system protein GspG [Thermoguttaceae bacterium]
MKSLARTPSQKSGFTLLELLIVLAILIVIIGILGTTVWSSYKKALVRAATVQVTTTLTNACEDFRLDFKRYPTNEEGLYILADMDNPNAPAQQDAGMGGMGGMGGQNAMGGMGDATGMGGQNAMGGDMTGMGNMGGDMTGMGGMGMDMQGGMGGMGGDTTGMGGGGMNMQGGTTKVVRRPKIVEPLIKEKDLIDPWN